MCIAATCGQGEFPGNSKTFWADIQDPSLPETFLSNVTFGMFGMGDSGYVFFNEVAKLIDDRMVELGANSLLPRGDGDDQDEDKWETAYEEWIPELWNELELGSRYHPLCMAMALITLETHYNRVVSILRT